MKIKITVLILVFLTMFNCSNQSFTDSSLDEPSGIISGCIQPNANRSDSMLPFNAPGTTGWAICNPDQLLLINATSPEYQLNNNYILLEDLDLQGKNFIPIDVFLGTFDGNHRTISNLSISSNTKNVGFFEGIGSTATPGRVMNLIFENANVKFSGFNGENMGILAGRMENEDSMITNVAALSGSVLADQSTVSGVNIGGLIGLQEEGDIISSMTNLNVTMSKGDSVGGVANVANVIKRIGGLVGYHKISGAIINSLATGNVSGGIGIDFIGGLVGRESATQAKLGGVFFSVSTGNVSNGGDSSDIMGGIAGLFQKGFVYFSVSDANISNGGNGSDFMGGLFGTIGNPFSSSPTFPTTFNSVSVGRVSDGGSDPDAIGTFAGDLLDGKIYSSYTLGSLQNTGMGELVAGFVGRMNEIKVDIRHSFWSTETTGLTQSSYNDAMPPVSSMDCFTTMEMKQCQGQGTSAFRVDPGNNFRGTTFFENLERTEIDDMANFKDSGNECLVRPILIQGVEKNTTAVFAYCPDLIDPTSFHPICRSKPKDCP